MRYVLQSQEPGWPNFVGNQVRAPGVGSLISSGDRWFLFFAGYDPEEAVDADGTFSAHHRRPYFTPVTVPIPDDVVVAAATDPELASWIVPSS